MTRSARALAAAALVAGVAIAAVPTPAQAACAMDWVANAGDYYNNAHLNIVVISTTGGDEEYLYKGGNSNGRAMHSRYYDVPSGWDMLGWDNLTSTPTWRRNATGRFEIPDQRCGGVYWFKGVLNGAGLD